MTRVQRWTLIATVLASATVFLDSTVVNVALPRIGRELPHTFVGVLEGQTYVYTGYLLSLSTLLILAGALFTLAALHFSGNFDTGNAVDSVRGFFS